MSIKIDINIEKVFGFAIALHDPMPIGIGICIGCIVIDIWFERKH